MTIRNFLLLAAVLIAGAALLWLVKDEAQTAPATPPSSSTEPTEPQRPRKPEFNRPPKDEAREIPQTAPAERPPEQARRPKPPSDPLQRFDEGRLRDLGYSPDTIQYIRALWEDSQEEREGRDERSATRKWQPASLRDADIKKGLRTDLGDDYYDAMLYATNQPNRARIGNVIGSSVTARAGLRIKDVVIRYDGERCFEPSDVKRLSEAAEPGKLVELWIRRDGEEIQLDVEGGALGVRYFPSKETPTSE